MSRLRKVEERIEKLEAREERLARLVEEGYSTGANPEETDRRAREFQEIRKELPLLLEEWESLAGDQEEDSVA